MTAAIRPRAAIARMPSEFGIREGRGKYLRLDYNENTIGCSPAVRRALATLSTGRIATYPEYAASREFFAKSFGVSADQIVLSNGADDALRLIFDAFVERRESILLVEPTFPMYRVYAGLFETRIISLRYGLAKGFPLKDVCKVLRQKRPRILFLTNPNNPTGTLLAKETIRRVLQAARGTLVVVDEAYFDFCGATVLPWIARYRNLVVIRTFSKANGLAGLRLGCILANKETVRALRKAQPPFPVNLAALVGAQAAAKDKGFARRIVKEVLAARRLVESFLREHAIPFWPSQTNFLLADFGPRGPQILRALERRGILLRDRTPDFGRPGWVRITIGSCGQMRRVMRALQEML